MAFIKKHLDDRFYLEGVSRVDVRNKIAREVCANLLMHREFSSTFVPQQNLIKSNDQVVTKSNDTDKILEFCKEPKNCLKLWM